MRELGQLLGIKKERAIETRRFDAHYIGISPQLLRATNFPDSNFSGYSLIVADSSDLIYRMDINTRVRWGTENPEHPGVTFNGYQDPECEVPIEDQLRRFIEAHLILVRMLHSVGNLRWYLEADHRAELRGYLEILPSSSDRSDGFSTVSVVADFVDMLDQNGLRPTGWYVAYFGGLTREQIVQCNFPRQSWIDGLIDSDSHKKVIVESLVASNS